LQEQKARWLWKRRAKNPTCRGHNANDLPRSQRKQRCLLLAVAANTPEVNSKLNKQEGKKRKEKKGKEKKKEKKDCLLKKN